MKSLLSIISGWFTRGAAAPDDPINSPAATPETAPQASTEAEDVTPSQQPRAVQYKPGDFQNDNQGLIEISKRYRMMEKLWMQETVDSEHPQRVEQAKELAGLWREIWKKSEQFYRQWQIEP